MECDRVKDLYKEACKNIMTEEENKKNKECIESIKLYIEYCLSNDFSKREKEK